MSSLSFEEEEFTNRLSGRVLVRILGLARPYWKRVVAFLGLVALMSLVDAYFNYLVKRLIDEAIVPGDRGRVAVFALTYAGIAICQAAAVFTMITTVGFLSERVLYNLRRRMFEHLQDLSLSYYDRTPVGWMMARVGSDTERMTGLVTWGLLDITWAVFAIGFSVVFMVRIDPRLALAVAAIVPLLVGVAIWFRTKIVVEYRKSRRINSRITGRYNENISGVRAVKAMGRERRNLQSFGELTGEMYGSSYRAAWLSALFLPAVQLISAFGLAVVVWLGGLEVDRGLLTLGGIQAFFGYVTFMLWPVQDLARVFADMQQSAASAERAFSLIDATPEVVDRPGACDRGGIAGDIVFDHVEFHYQADKPVLRDFCLHVRQGETIALVGPTGGGKSTIVNLVCRFYEPRRGTIRIGGVDYLDMTLHAIHSRIGIVLQTPHLFSGSVRENIRYGRLDATDAEVQEAARLAGAEEFIAGLAKGYDEDVGEGGNRLSVGQRQLVSLARAVLVRPDIFVMDEATSSVDSIAEALIQQGMEHLMKGRTSFIIAHRLSTIRRANRILVVEDGRIAESGTHAELIHTRGHYYTLYTNQFRHEREEAYDLLAPDGGGASPPDSGLTALAGDRGLAGDRALSGDRGPRGAADDSEPREGEAG
jgi:ATP-binding cassette subfamily B protein